MKHIFLTLSAVAILLAAACSSKEQWSVSGNIEGASGKTILLESIDNGRWIILDSAKIADNGNFKFRQPRAAYPDIYRLNIDGASVYFPIDSLENISVTSSLSALERNAKIAGSPSADLMQKVNDRVAAATPGDSLVILDIANMLQNNWGSIVAYYTINKTVDGKPLFNPAVSLDRRVINAVANAYTNYLSGDPRAKMLREKAMEINRTYGRRSPGQAIEAQEVPFLEISMLDKSGKPRSLTEEWQKGRVIVLNFTLYESEDSPALNAQLAQLYSQYHDQGLEIYQVACDTDEQQWLQTVRNLPWISVYNSPDDGNRTLRRYNISVLPTIFVIDRTGEHFDRVTDLDQLTTLVKKYI